MTIKIKLIAILVLMVSILGLISGFMIKSYLTAQDELTKSSSAVFELSRALEIRMIVNLQVKATVDYIVTGNAAYKDRSRILAVAIDDALDDWERSSQEIEEMGEEMESEDLTRLDLLRRHYNHVLELEKHAFELLEFDRKEEAYALIHEHIRGVTDNDLNGLIENAVIDEMSEAQISYLKVASSIGAIYWVTKGGLEKVQEIWFALNDLLALSKTHFYIAQQLLNATEYMSASTHEGNSQQYGILARFELNNWITSSRIGLSHGLTEESEDVDRALEVQQAYLKALDLINQLSGLSARKEIDAAHKIFEMQLIPLSDALLYKTMTVAFNDELDEIAVAHDDLQRYVHRGGIMGLCVMAALAAIIIGFSLSIISGILRSIRKITLSTDIIRGGNLDHRIGITTRDEFGRLAKGFDEMTASLQRSGSELKELNRTLETRVRSRTEELSEAVSSLKVEIAAHRRTEAALKQAKQAAEAASEAKSMFLANMSHEIRTPLNGVIGMTGLLLDTQLTDQQREWAETARTSGDALLTVINDILDYSKIEAGKLDMEIIDFDLRVTLEDMSDMLAMTAQAKGLEFACLVHDEVPALLKGDPGRLRQILINLANNAIKFTAEGEVSVHVSLDEEDETSATIRFRVIDTGIGIPGNRLNALFNSFSQVDASTTRKYGGTGLGLAISKKLTEMMGGQIGVMSEEGKGSTFWFSVHLEKQDSTLQERFNLPEDIQGERILIVDDNKTNRDVLTHTLTRWGCRFDKAENGQQALDILVRARTENDPFGIALLDMQMPVMDGETLGKRIRQDPRLAPTRLVMLTSMGSIGDAARMKKIGFDAYLSKPIKRSQLYDCLITVSRSKPADVENRQEKMVTRHTITEAKKQMTRILVAEDNAVNQKVIQITLERLGYRADIVVNGREAVSALETAPYDIVFMDVQMPEMDGFAATRIIRDPNSSVIDHGTPIVAMTAHAMKGDREKCLSAGMDDYTTKPINPKDVLEKIEKWAGRPAAPG